MCVAPHGECLRVKTDMVLSADNTVRTISERVGGVREDALYKSTLSLPLPLSLPVLIALQQSCSAFCLTTQNLIKHRG